MEPVPGLHAAAMVAVTGFFVGFGAIRSNFLVGWATGAADEER